MLFWCMETNADVRFLLIRLWKCLKSNLLHVFNRSYRPGNQSYMTEVVHRLSCSLTIASNNNCTWFHIIFASTESRHKFIMYGMSGRALRLVMNGFDLKLEVNYWHKYQTSIACRYSDLLIISSLTCRLVHVTLLYIYFIWYRMRYPSGE